MDVGSKPDTVASISKHKKGLVIADITHGQETVGVVSC